MHVLKILGSFAVTLVGLAAFPISSLAMDTAPACSVLSQAKLEAMLDQSDEIYGDIRDAVLGDLHGSVTLVPRDSALHSFLAPTREAMKEFGRSSWGGFSVFGNPGRAYVRGGKDDLSRLRGKAKALRARLPSAKSMPKALAEGIKADTVQAGYSERVLAHAAETRGKIDRFLRVSQGAMNHYGCLSLRALARRDALAATAPPVQPAPAVRRDEPSGCGESGSSCGLVHRERVMGAAAASAGQRIARIVQVQRSHEEVGGAPLVKGPASSRSMTCEAPVPPSPVSAKMEAVTMPEAPVSSASGALSSEPGNLVSSGVASE